MSFKVLITTSGTGSRLGELTKYTNKALVRVGKRPAISYIIDSYPKNTEFVVVLGYKGDQVKDFLSLVYPELKIAYVSVPKFEGPGSSLGHSMLRAKNLLQCPFIFHACDTIIEERVPAPTKNWIGSYIADKNRVLNSNEYRTHKAEKDRVLSINDKGAKNFQSIHIGLIGIKDYKFFWQSLQDIVSRNQDSTAHSDVDVINRMIKNGIVFNRVLYKKWLDVGNLRALDYARKNISDRFDNLDKVDEALFFFKDFVIKFFSDSQKIKDRVRRGKILGELVPRTLSVRNNFYKYEFVEGKKYSSVATANDFRRFLDWSIQHLWIPAEEVPENKFKKICLSFYREKTLERVDKLMRLKDVRDGETIINGTKIPSLKRLFSQVDFSHLSNGRQTGFHGDYILENILKTKSGYMLLDWRQDFGGLLKSGDMYYDLAKLYHNLVVNHDIISNERFMVERKGKAVNIKIARLKNLQNCEKVLEKWVIENDFDLNKVRVLRALIWLNMSPLHHDPFNIFLFYQGKYNLWKALQNK